MRLIFYSAGIIMTFYKQITIVLIMALFVAVAPGAALGFSDTRAHWARPPIDHLQSRELLSGYPDGTYRPDAYVSREEFVTLIVKALKKEPEARQLEKGSGFFADTRQRWSRGFVDLARELDITAGDGMGNFHPQRIVTRQEAVTLLVNALHNGEELTDEGEALFFDSDAIQDWARASVTYAYQHGIIKGFPDTTFRPGEPVTRAQVAVMLEQFLDLQGQKHHMIGNLLDINLSLRQAVIEIDGQRHNFEMDQNLVVYGQDSPEPLTELSLPSSGYFDLDPEGKLAYACLVRDLPDAQLEITTSRLIPAPSQPASSVRTASTLVQLADETDDDMARTSLDNPGTSLNNTRQAMRVHDFIAESGATGRGQLVAVIDSGIDPGHPDLQTTVDDYPTLVDFLDFTDDGKVDLSRLAKPVDGVFTVAGQSVNVEGLTNAADDFRYGFLSASVLPASFSDGLRTDQILVVAAASQYWYIYDTIYIDTDGDGDITDEKPLKRYTSGEYTGIIGAGDKRLNVVVTEISNDPFYVKLGFDGLGHGTEVAGVVAANGEVEGIAPGAQLLGIKILNRLGQASISVLQEALEVAGQRGARVAVVSLGQYQLSNRDHDQLSATAELMWKKYQMIICMAAGNNGPGINTVTRSSALGNVISVGAYATPQMWYRDYGWIVEEPTLWYFSSVGPSADGLLAPTLIAPGNAISTYPLWGDSIYRLEEGTSMAAPHVAGAVALLLDVATHQLYKNDTLAVYQALISGAVPLDSLQPAEQGFGTVNMMKAWQELKDMNDSFTAYEVSQYTPGFGYGQGLYSRGMIPSQMSVQIKNTSTTGRQLAVGGLSDWIQPSQYWLQIPANSERRINIEYQGLEEPGLYSNFLVADDMDTPGTDLNILQTVMVPHDLAGQPKDTLTQTANLPAGQFKRYFLQVPEGTGQLELKLDVGQKGRARMHVISPWGWQEVSSYAGVGETMVREQASLTFDKPAAGVWEVVVYSSSTLSTFDLKQTNYKLEASLKDVTAVAQKKPIDRYLITAVPSSYQEEGQLTVTLHFWHYNTKVPAAGVVMINNRLYELEQGTVTLTLPLNSTPIPLHISW